MGCAVPQPIFTIGHSNHPIERFLELITMHGVEIVADVRSVPHSRLHPQYRRVALRRALQNSGVRYQFLGRELGGRPEDPTAYVNQRVSYKRLAQTALFRSGIEHLLTLAPTSRVALVCAEKEPLDCHRTVLVARELVQEGATVHHILADGALEPHVNTLRRLRTRVGLPVADLFASDDELTAEAYTRQERRIAYVVRERSATVWRETEIVAA